jgi:hypothetical protein
MDKKTLTTLFSEALYQIPDYQRGYAWEEKQWRDFIQDVDALVDEQVTSHYTGTVVVYVDRSAAAKDYGTKRMKVMDVVDGQQRLTSCCLYLAAVLRALTSKGKTEYERDIETYLYSGVTCKIRLNNDTGSIFYDLLKTGRANTPPRSPHEKRLCAAYERFHGHVQQQVKLRDKEGIPYLKELFHALTQKLDFTFYTIQEECEIGMTFELMNSRGKELSVLELLKNYLMHWVSRNEANLAERKRLTGVINKSWKDTYTNLGMAKGREDQCLRIAWTLHCDHTPKNWVGYDGFKDDAHIPLRNFKVRSKEETKDFMLRFTEGLAEISRHYASITNPTAENTLTPKELVWLNKIHNTGNIANFLPLLAAARMCLESGKLPEAEYLELLRSLECYAYRVFLTAGRRSNAGQSGFYRWGNKLVKGEKSAREIIDGVHELLRWYAPEEAFLATNGIPDNWYMTRHRLKYTLFEYELHLLEAEGKGKAPQLQWGQLNDSTIEHILPQTPKDGSHWKKVWPQKDFDTALHDIGNLVLTQNNSNYLNFEFDRKKGKPGLSPSYANSDIRQERKLSVYGDWTPREYAERRKDLAAWIATRWKSMAPAAPVDPALIEDEDEEDGE